ncbi:IKI3 family-domain-containing protein [Neohortaea acidophila]|uniref:Elongator complex protein 1 n=1 Tax=Neohortaea acidophila TaxID=245834 RepID=A0A6A6PK32_9PEZI|nr:IKI3 family-domain-containing protein [Neohortaea acidophila]KAF2480024.1 IKI3 family-domain-containing protein [Neohortaea acidophila]
MLARPATRVPFAAVARRGFHSTRPRFASPYHYPEGPRNNIPFNPLTRFFYVRYWGSMAFAFSIPFLVAGKLWQCHSSTPPKDIMHNLRNTRHDKLEFQDATLSATAWDVNDDSTILAFGPTADSPVITLKRLLNDAQHPADASTIASWDAPSPNPDLAVDHILNLHYFPDSKAISLVLAGGDIVVVREDPQPGEDLIEIVGSVDAGITAAAWSSDEELLAVTTQAQTLLLMTRSFESAANIALTPEDVNVSNHVSVGWGKKETQFKGRGVAKTLRDPTMPEHVDEGTLSSLDDGNVSISWRGDGQYFAINSILDVQPKRRIIRVYSRDGVLESVSEPVNCLEGPLSWKPNGQLIAGVQRLDDVVRVVFFERNGLRHGEFDLRPDSHSTPSHISLEWNIDSTVLAVSMRDRVQLWIMSNYHYYLKQETRLGDSSSSYPWISWHPEKPLHLSAANNGKLRSLSYRGEVCRGSVTPPNDLGTVAVIDGQVLKITPLRRTNIPPPMAYEEIALPANALDVAIHEAGHEIAVLHHDSITLWTCDYFAKPAKKATLTSTLIRHDHVYTDNDDVEASRWARVVDSEHLHIRTDHDRISYFEQNTHATSDPCEVSWRAPGGVQLSCRIKESGLLRVQQNEQPLQITGCTSYIITASHLIYTTNQHRLKFIHLHPGRLEIAGDEPEKDERCRSIERGAKIITAIPSAYSVILQMPRGNLETIYPRALVLAGVRQSVRDRDYKKAFLTCRTQRVDMNILHDYLPDQFMQDVGLFVKQVKKTEYIDLFLSSLSEENVSETMYRDTIAPVEEPTVNGTAELSQASIPSKINKICDAFLKVLRTQDTENLQNIVTAHVCKKPPDLESGLKLVSELRSKAGEAGLEEAVEHICFLADVNRLYDTALGLYDLEVALLVAQQAQKDPREYIPYLEALHNMPQLRKQFTIDNDLKRYNKAITHLHALDVFDELKHYMTKHELFSATIDLYRYDNARLSELMRLYADFLSNRNRFPEAGVAYESISDYRSAYEAYASANLWQECLSSASLVPLSTSDLSNLASSLADGMEEIKNFTAAAAIHLDYLNDLDTSARLLCKGYLFAEAIRQITLHRKPELLSSIIDPGLVDASASLTEMLSEMKSQLGAQVPRLRELRQKKAEDPMAFLDGAEGGGGDTDIPDNLSLAGTDASTTGGTFMTRYTNQTDGTLATNATRKTSKNRRREERKRARGKKGTVYEEEYLENSIARLIERLNDTNGDIIELIRCLMRRGMRERASAVQVAMADVMEICRTCMDEVFAPNAMVGNVDGDQQQTETNGVSRPWGGEGVLWEAMRTQRKEAPVLKSFDTLTLC